jgi:hypothetical protein
MRAWNCAGTLVRAKGIEPVIARRGTAHGSGRGRYRWVVEQAIALLHWFRRLRIRWEIRDDIHEAFPHPRMRRHLLASAQDPLIVLGPLSPARRACREVGSPLEMRGVAEKQVCGISALVHAALLNSPGAEGRSAGLELDDRQGLFRPHRSPGLEPADRRRSRSASGFVCGLRQPCEDGKELP